MCCKQQILRECLRMITLLTLYGFIEGGGYMPAGYAIPIGR